MHRKKNRGSARALYGFRSLFVLMTAMLVAQLSANASVTLTEQARFSESIDYSIGGPKVGFGSVVAIDGDLAVITASNTLGPDEFQRAIVHERVNGTWIARGVLRASDAIPGLRIGYRARVSGDTIIVNGDSDAGRCVLLFQKPADGWADMTETAVLTASDSDKDSAFGLFLDIDGDVIVVGDEEEGEIGGAVYVYQRPAGRWISMTQTAKLTAQGASSLGRCVAIDGDTIVAGAQGGSNAGAVCVYQKPAQGWTSMTQNAKLTTTDGSVNVGESVDISGDLIVSGTQVSKVYLYVKPAGGWTNATQTVGLSAPDVVNGDLFGNVVAASNDTIVVGAARADNGVSGSDFGAAYVFVKPGSGWASLGGDLQAIAKLTASDPAPTDRFGTSVAISGETLLASTSLKDLAVPAMADAGAAYAFDKPAAGWQDSFENQEIVLDASGVLCPADKLGGALAIDGDIAVLGMPGDDGVTTDEGAALVFQRYGSTWQLLARLSSSTPIANGKLASTLAISGDTIVLATPEGSQLYGKIHVYVRPPSGWHDMTETARLTTSLGNVFANTAVSVSDDAIAVGAVHFPTSAANQGAVLVYQKPASGWSNMIQTAVLTSSTPSNNDRLGQAVALSGHAIVAGAPLDDGTLSDEGTVYVYERPAGGWANMTQTGVLKPSTPLPLGNFGTVVALDDDVAVVGGSQIGAGGTVYVFQRSGGLWTSVTQAGILSMSASVGSGTFGQSVAIDGDAAIVGRAKTNLSGAAFVYFKPASGWGSKVEDAVLKASNTIQSDGFAASVALSGETVVVAAAMKDGDAGEDQGEVYAFHINRGDCNGNGRPDLADIGNATSLDLNGNGFPDECDPQPCPGDVSNDQIVGIDDLFLVISAWGPCANPDDCSGDIAPADGDGVVDADDLFAVVNSWGGCP